MENQVVKNISSFIYSHANKENDELLKLTGYGLKKMPELAFSYQCGKEIFRFRNIILNSSRYKWEREYTIKGVSGPSDAVYISEDKDLPNYVIEFKLDATWNKYLADIEKLKKIKDDNWVKLFCSFKHVFIENDLDQGNDFKQKLEEKFGLGTKLIEECVFKTKVKSDQKDHFLYTFWQVY